MAGVSPAANRISLTKRLVERQTEVVVVLWWIGNIVLIAVVAPTCLFFLNRVLRPTFEIKAYADDILDHGVKLTGNLDAVPKLLKTRELTGVARQGVGRYGAALQRIL